jgi:MYXO-CTERM domain-containing protein
VWGVRVTLDGGVLDPQPLEIIKGPTTQLILSIAASPDALLATWDDGTPQIVYRRFSVDGGAIDAAPVAIAPGTLPWATFDGRRFGIAYSTPSVAPKLALLDDDGGAVTYDLCPGCPSSPRVEAVTSSAGFTFVVMLDLTATTLLSVYSDDAGVGATGVTLPGQGGVSAIGGNGAQLLYVWPYTDGGYQTVLAERLTPEGTSLDPGGFVVEPSLKLYNPPGVAADDGGYWIVWSDVGPARDLDLFARRVTTAGALDGPPIVVSSFSTNEHEVQVAAGTLPTLLVYSRYDTDPRELNQRVRARVLSPQPPPAMPAEPLKARILTVGCACDAGGPGLLPLVMLAAARRRRLVLNSRRRDPGQEVGLSTLHL